MIKKVDIFGSLVGVGLPKYNSYFQVVDSKHYDYDGGLQVNGARGLEVGSERGFCSESQNENPDTGGPYLENVRGF